MARVSDKSVERYATTLAEKERRGKKLTPREKEVLDLRDARALLREYAPDDWFAALHRDPDMCNPECEHCLVHGCIDENPCNDWDNMEDCVFFRVPHCADNCPYPKAKELLGYAAT